MTSPKQINANQKNAQKSTGPKTEEGKISVSKNALKHGLLSTETTLLWEDIDQLEILRKDLLGSLKPEGELELVFADRIISLTWRLRRAGRIETGIFAWHKYGESLSSVRAEAHAYIEFTETFGPIDLNVRTKTITDKKNYDAAMKKVSHHSADLNSDVPTLGRHFVQQADNLGKLHRYEVGLEKSLFKALHELQRLQATRLGNKIAVPLAVDIFSEDGSEF